MRFRIINKNPLYDYREACKLTEGIDLWDDLSIEHIFTPKDEVEFWIKQIVANHSTIRSVHFRLVDKRPKSVIMQLIRATKGHPQPEVESSRPDLIGTVVKKEAQILMKINYLCKIILQNHLLKWQGSGFVTERKREQEKQCRKW